MSDQHRERDRDREREKLRRVDGVHQQHPDDAPGEREPAHRPLTPPQALQRSVGNSRLLQLRATLQRQTMPVSSAPPWIRDRIAERQSSGELEQEHLEEKAESIPIPAGGQPLDPEVRARAEGHLGVPMGDVRVVTGADAACKPIQAKAFTTDDGGTPKVVMASDTNPQTRDGQFTLMHELTHVAQQKQGMTGDLRGLGGDGGHREHLEQHADTHAEKMCTDPTHHH